tara:strand:- start:1150 stop:1722 length:573 start_codon:yes stop_codon:yes gene_type:complete
MNAFLNSRIALYGLILAHLIFFYAFITNDIFFEWAFARHQNIWSWIVRPLLMLPFCYFAYCRSINGIFLSTFAILTSMFWFPIPEETNQQVERFLYMERERIQAGFDWKNIVSIVAVIIFLTVTAGSFWKRSLLWGGAAAIAGAIAKIMWSVMESPDNGYAVIPFAVGGIVVLLLGLFIVHLYRGNNKTD